MRLFPRRSRPISGSGQVETGLLASIYFLVFAGAQIPIGVLLDRYGSRRVQSVLLVTAVGGASLFGNADSFAELLIGRANDRARCCRATNGWA
jgi:MFS family permease